MNLIFYLKKIKFLNSRTSHFSSCFEGRSLKMIGKYLKFGEHPEQKSVFFGKKMSSENFDFFWVLESLSGMYKSNIKQFD